MLASGPLPFAACARYLAAHTVCQHLHPSEHGSCSLWLWLLCSVPRSARQLPGLDQDAERHGGSGLRGAILDLVCVRRRAQPVRSEGGSQNWTTARCCRERARRPQRAFPPSLAIHCSPSLASPRLRACLPSCVPAAFTRALIGPAAPLRALPLRPGAPEADWTTTGPTPTRCASLGGSMGDGVTATGRLADWTTRRAGAAQNWTTLPGPRARLDHTPPSPGEQVWNGGVPGCSSGQLARSHAPR